MSGKLLDTYPASSTIYAIFDTFGASGESITLTGLAVTDIEIFKNDSVTQRSSDAGYALLDTDGIDFDTRTGIHGISIDLSDNTDSGFYAVGSQYTVVIDAVTINSQTVRFVLGSFRIVAAEAITGKPKVDVDGWLGTAAATPTVAGVPEVDVTHFNGSAGTFASGRPEVNINSIANGAITAAAIAADAIGASELAADAVAEIADAVWDEAASGHTTAGSFGKATSDILVDTAEIGAAGAGLTNINLPDQTMNITGDITGNLSGSVGSVTGAVGSVTGAVGSVTGNVGGNVTGSVGSLAAQAKADVNAEVVDVLNTDTFAEPGQGAPGATITLAAKIGYLYKAWRNKKEQTATEFSLYADDAATVDQKSTVSDDGTTTTVGEMATGA